ncbi:hypothetical protein HanPSC8_Chr16g0696951 [Helianthus annuus]|nr:hypothetical protein HanPSC8_Chr16g0696951 [Helianthus annuus]
MIKGGMPFLKGKIIKIQADNESDPYLEAMHEVLFFNKKPRSVQLKAFRRQIQYIFSFIK